MRSRGIVVVCLIPGGRSDRGGSLASPEIGGNASSTVTPSSRTPKWQAQAPNGSAGLLPSRSSCSSTSTESREPHGSGGGHAPVEGPLRSLRGLRPPTKDQEVLLNHYRLFAETRVPTWRISMREPRRAAVFRDHRVSGPGGSGPATDLCGGVKEIPAAGPVPLSDGHYDRRHRRHGSCVAA